VLPLSMPAHGTEAPGKKLTIVIGLTVVGAMAFGLMLSYYRNVLFEQLLIDMEHKNQELQANIAQGHRQLEYYRSVQYKDRYAKENLDRINTGEKILILTDTSQQETDIYSVEEGSAQEQQEAAYLELLRQMPVMEHWKLYFFRRESLRELRRSFQLPE